MTHQVLLADDSATMRRAVEIALSWEDVSIASVSNGDAAITLARRNKPAVALIDIGMPDLDGYSVCKTIKNDPETAHIRVILLSNHHEPVDSARVRACGADMQITKPFETQMLANSVMELVSKGPAPPLEIFAPIVHSEPSETLVEPVQAPIRIQASTRMLEDEAQLRKIVYEVAHDIIERIAWEVVPKLAESMLQEQLKE